MFRRIRTVTARLRRETQPPTLRLKLGLMMLVPLTVIGVFAAGAAQGKLSDRSDAREMRQRAELVLAAGELVHQLQRERGLSAMAIASASLPLADRVRQRAATDQAEAKLDSLLTEFDATSDQRFTFLSDAVGAGWERLLHHRSLVDQSDMGPAEVMAPYTALIEQHLDLVTHTNMTPTGSVVPLGVAYSDFLVMKERSALVRGILGAATAAGTLSDDDDAELRRLVTEEQAHLQTFLDRAPTALLSAYRAAIEKVAVQEALERRAALMSRDLLLPPTDGAQLFEVLSVHIDALLTVERQIVDLIMTEASARDASAASRLAIIAAAGVLSLVLCFAVLAVAARSIARPMHSLAKAARRIAVGDSEAPPSEWAEDAIGEIGLAFDDMRLYLRDVAGAAEKLAWGDLDVEIEPRSSTDTLGHSLAAMTRRLSMSMQESEFRSQELEHAVHQLRESEDKLRLAASHDGLTGLPNRATFLDRLDTELNLARRTGTRVAVAFVDLDQFKSVNDTFGHEAGDRLLQLTAERLRAGVRAMDTVARLGGDEFALVLPGMGNARAADELMERLLATLRAPYDVGARMVTGASSIGLAFYPNDGRDPATLLARADEAMYRSKRQGGATHSFYSEEDGSERAA